MTKLLKKTLLAVFLIFLLYSLSSNILEYQEKVDFYKEYKKEYEQEKEINKKLKSDILKSKDYYAIERKIREKLNLLKPGEIAVIIPESTPAPTPTREIEKKPYKQWMELFLQGSVQLPRLK